MPSSKRKGVKLDDAVRTDKTSEGRSKDSCRNNSSSTLFQNQLNIVKNFDYSQRKGVSWPLKHTCERIVCRDLRRFKVEMACHFGKRVTAISWIENKLSFVIGHKTGALFWYSICKDKNLLLEKFHWHGGGPGLSLLSIHFPPTHKNKMLTASIDGTVRLWDLENPMNKPDMTLLSTGTIAQWYCSVSTSHETGQTLAGDTKGHVKLMDKDLNILSTYKLHKSKVNTIEFNRRDGRMFTTASVDKTVKLFDLRNLDKPIKTLEHNKVVNCASFSPNSQKLLTTDQHDEIRVYSGVEWSNKKVIYHPHRHYMYLTPIRASWHPICDLVVIGRYPDPRSKYDGGDVATVDVYSGETFELMTQLFDKQYVGIFSLNEFNSTGEYLLSGMGVTTALWRTDLRALNIQSKYTRDHRPGNDKDDRPNDDDAPPDPKKSRSNRPRSTKPTSESEIKQKQKKL